MYAIGQASRPGPTTSISSHLARRAAHEMNAMRVGRPVEPDHVHLVGSAFRAHRPRPPVASARPAGGLGAAPATPPVGGVSVARRVERHEGQPAGWAHHVQPAGVPADEMYAMGAGPLVKLNHVHLVAVRRRARRRAVRHRGGPAGRAQPRPSRGSSPACPPTRWKSQGPAGWAGPNMSISSRLAGVPADDVDAMGVGGWIVPRGAAGPGAGRPARDSFRGSLRSTPSTRRGSREGERPP